MVTTTENKQVTINVSLQANRSTWLGAAAAGALLVVGILTAVTLGIAWMGTSVEDFGGESISYKLSEIRTSGVGIEYGEAGDGEADGTGFITTANVLAIIATTTAFLATLVVVAGIFVRHAAVKLTGNILATLTALLIMLVVVFAPLGISQFHDDTFGQLGGSLSWGAGLIMGIVAATVALAASVLGWMSRPAQ